MGRTLFQGNGMRGFFKWFGLGVFGAVAIAVCLYTVSWLMPIPAEDAEALALVEAPRPIAGRNGFAALWSLPFDIPVADAERLLAGEAARFQTLPVWSGEGAMPVHASALERYPRLDDPDPDKTLCGARQTNCLAQVQARLPELTPVMASRAAIAARIAALEDRDHFRSPFPARPDTPLPAYRPLFDDLVGHAHAFVQGNHGDALRGVCRSGSIARKLVASGDTLVGGVVGASLMDASVRLFVEMLAELPADYPLPETCGEVFEADGVMVAGICPTMIGEGKFIAGGLRALNGVEQPWHRELATGLFFDLRKTMAMSARRHAWYCSPQADALVRADVALDDHAPLEGGWRFSCLGNPVGCVVDNIAAPSLAGYAERFQDTEARLRMVSAWRSLRGQGDDARPLARRLDAWQRAHPEGRKIRVSADGDGLEIDLFNDRQGSVFALPLPAAGDDVRPQ